MKKLKIVQIGAEHDHAAPVMKSLKRLSDVFEIAGYVVPEGEIITDPTPYGDVKQLTMEEAFNIPDLDAVIIETGELNLTKYALMAAKKGFDIHMDKPGGMELCDFKELIEIVKKNKTVFHMGYMYRYNPAVIKLMKDIEDGKLGEVYCVEAHMNCMHTPEKRQWLEKFKGGEMFYLGCHLIDSICRIMGKPLEVIPLNCSTGFDGVTAEDYGMAVLKYKNGVSFAKSCDNEPSGFLRRQLTVCGSKGKVEILPIEVGVGNDNNYAVVNEVLDRIDDWDYSGEKYKTEVYNRYDNMLRSFAEYVRGEKQNPFTYDYELEVYETVLKACGIEK